MQKSNVATLFFYRMSYFFYIFRGIPQYFYRSYQNLIKNILQIIASKAQKEELYLLSIFHDDIFSFYCNSSIRPLLEIISKFCSILSCVFLFSVAVQSETMIHLYPFSMRESIVSFTQWSVVNPQT